MVLGKTVLPNGDAPWDLKLQMGKAVQLLENEESATLVLTGGVTRPGFRSEAEVAMAFVPYELQSRAWLEKRSMSTKQNIEHVRDHFMGESEMIDSIIVISTPGHELRTRFLFWKLWPKMLPRLSFENVGSESFGERLFHLLLFVVVAIDPEEKVFLPLKKHFVK